MIFTEQRRQFMRLIDQFLLADRPRHLEKLELMPQILGLLTPLVEILHALIFRRRSERAMTCPVYTPEATLHGGPTVPLDRPIRKSRERSGGDFFHCSERSVLVKYAAGHVLPICEQSLVNLRKCSRLDRFRELLSELIRGFDENLCIADLGERPGGVAKTKVLFMVKIVAEVLAHQAESGPHSLEALADIPDGFV